MSPIKAIAAILLGCLTVFTVASAATTTRAPLKPAAYDLSKFDVVYDQRQKGYFGNVRVNTDGILVAVVPQSTLTQGAALLEAGDLLEDYPELLNLFNEEFGLGSSEKPTQGSSSTSTSTSTTSPSTSSTSAGNELSTAKSESTSQAGAKFKSGSSSQVEKKRKLQNAASILKSLLRAKVSGEN